MKILRTLFQIEHPKNAHPVLYHVELNEPLPTSAKVRDVITIEPHSLGTTFELWGVRHPASNYCTVRPVKS